MGTVVLREGIIMKSYLSKKEAAEEFSLCVREMYRIVSDIRDLMGKRYGEYAVIGHGKTERVAAVVLIDYLRYRTFIGTSLERPFREAETRRYLIADRCPIDCALGWSESAKKEQICNYPNP